jgi:hypothetical protein
MITLQQQDISSSGGILAALADKSCECFASVLRGHLKPIPEHALRHLDRTIVHTDPHLDEYFAELLFRACLPSEKWQCPFEEQSIYSADSSLGGQLIWPTAATVGLPVAIGAGVRPLFFFDEHVAGQKKIAPSVSQIVADQMLTSIPSALAVMLSEMNAIDEFGGGHPQNLNNLIKTLHEARFFFGQDPSTGGDIRDGLTPEWKRAIVDVCLASVLKCLADGVDLLGDPAAKRAALASSLENYISHSIHSSHPRFLDAVQRIRSVFGDQARVFQEAVLQGRHGPLKDAQGNTTPQLLVLSRVCFACEHCWGQNIRDIIATHFWEQELQRQLNFFTVQQAVQSLFSQPRPRLVTPAGILRKAELPPIEIQSPAGGHHKQAPGKKRPVWVVSVSPASGVFKPNQAISNFINQNNDGCGLILIRDTVLGTSVLFKCSGIPDPKWRRLVDEIVKKEGKTVEPGEGKPEDCGCWHVPVDSAGGMPPFIVNGNKAHQYVPRSALDGAVLCELVKRTFY